MFKEDKTELKEQSSEVLATYVEDISDPEFSELNKRCDIWEIPIVDRFYLINNKSSDIHKLLLENPGEENGTTDLMLEKINFEIDECTDKLASDCGFDIPPEDFFRDAVIFLGTDQLEDIVNLFVEGRSGTLESLGEALKVFDPAYWPSWFKIINTETSKGIPIKLSIEQNF